MTMMSLKKISAAAVAAVLGFSAVSHAGTIYSDPTDPVSGTYTNLDSPSGATFVGGTLTSGGAGSAATPDFGDFQPTAGDSTTLTPALLPGAPGGQVLTATVNIDLGQTGASGTDPQFGVNIIDGSGQVAAGFYVQYGPDGLPDLLASTPTGYAPVSGFAAAGAGTDGTYTLTYDPTDQGYTVSYAGQTYTGTSYPESGTVAISGVTLSDIDQGTSGTATFGDFSVVTSVPEPASIAMVGIGGLMLLAKRPKRLA